MSSRISAHIFALFTGIVVTCMLFSLLIFGTTYSNTVEVMPDLGAVKLSSYEDKPVKEEVYTTQDVPVPEMEDITEVEMPEVQLDMPRPDLKLAGLDLDITPVAVGTVPLSGMPEMADSGAAAAPSGGALTLGEVDEKPRVLYAPSPLYPSGHRGSKKKRVTVRILINQHGDVEKILPQKVSDELLPYYRAAEEAISMWRFLPCKKSGTAVKCLADQPVSFIYRK